MTSWKFVLQWLERTIKHHRPTSPPFVDIGSVVDVDDPLCLIEVMKLYTTISAKARGRVIEICTENGAMVGANEILFRIEPL